jgi:pyruvate ferredoxin oxidoreductase gamma subunit
MFEVRIHGRGGQGVVTAAELLSVAAFDEGKNAQAFPTFGSERSGAPLVAFCRVDEKPIRIHEPIAEPDALIVQDPTLLHQVKVFEGVGPKAFVLINTSRTPEELGIGEFSASLEAGRLISVPATKFALERLGRPLPNAALLGGFAALTEVVSLTSVIGAIKRRFSGQTGEANALAARDAYEFVTHERIRYTHA